MASGQQPMTRRTVVSCFIIKFPPNASPLVALFRRSDKVRTYQGRLAPISGSVDKADASPLHAAWREIAEETCLTSANLTLLRQGKDYKFSDQSIGREWTIFPYAFGLNAPEDEANIQIDWEHTGFQWFDPRDVEDVDSFGGVPRLAESLRRVWFEVEIGEKRGRILNGGLLALRKDHESGARQLAGTALDVLLDIVGESDKDLVTWWKNVRLAAWHLWKNGRESMGASILNVVVRSLALVEEQVKRAKENEVTQAFLRDVVNKLEAYKELREESASGIWKTLEAFLRENEDASKPIRILTLSFSSTILNCLQRSIAGFGSEFDIRILESRPLFEGVSTASKLVGGLTEAGVERDKRVNVSIYTDASAAIASEDIDLLLIGADLIDNAGATSNKTGSLPAVLAAKHSSPGVKVLVLADSEKVLPYERPESEENDAGEVVDAWRREESLRDAVATVMGSVSGDVAEEKGVRASVKNVYFEWVPSSLIDGYLFEDGRKSSEDVSVLAGRIRREADAFFADV
ncbi:Ribose 1,5-bisphosphate isomerase [Colletotrichum sidae]|uniref:Ribose 1,5-bisphosphate isomerase n=1 Tax=Colletotrichum sidae TaxID=1347389 RepID=A0A4R8TM59_9PEZI|nr:Ribose 1,5-bisphosphate isomerase [Colletotrichum sidae]